MFALRREVTVGTGTGGKEHENRCARGRVVRVVCVKEVALVRRGGGGVARSDVLDCVVCGRRVLRACGVLSGRV